MIQADLVLTEFEEVATLARGPVPRSGRAMQDLALVREGAVAVDRGKVVFVGRAEDARRKVRLKPGGTRRKLPGCVAVPGFVDAHTHLLFAGDRASEVVRKVHGASYLDLVRSGGGLQSTVHRTRRASSASLLASAQDRLERMLRFGTTTAEVKSGYALTHAGELRLLSLIPVLARRTGVRLVPTFLGAHAVPPEFRRSSDRYVNTLVARTIPAVARAHLARFCDAFCEPGFFSLGQTERILRAGSSVGLLPKIHADEFAATGGGRLAARLHAVSADHLLQTPIRDYKALSTAGTIAVVLPVTPFASFTPSVGLGRDLVDRGVSVALGTDLSPNSWVESMPTVLAHAVYGSRLTPAEALTAATVNAAAAVGAAGEAGTIAVGRPADLVIFDFSSVEQLGYRIGAVPVEVYRQGIRVSSR